MDGPLREWGASFSSASGVDWRTAPGSVSLDYSAVLLGLGSAGRGARRIECGDVYGDGDCDIAVLDGAGSLFIYENRDSGRSFAAHAACAPSGGSPPSSMALADLDGDGDLDAAVCTRDGGVSWLENAGTDPWTEHVISIGERQPAGVCACDVDRDGDRDLVVSLSGSLGVAWFENPGPAGVWARHDLRSDAHCFAVMQSDGFGPEGGPDILAPDLCSGTAMLMEVVGDSLRATPITNCDGQCAFAGLDSAGCLQVAAAWTCLDGVLWCRLGPDGWTSMPAGPGMIAPDLVCCADFDGDGDSDICAASSSTGEVSWWENLGAGAFSLHDAGFLAGCSWCSAGDIDSDGVPEIAVCSGTDGTIGYYDADCHACSGSLTSAILYLPDEPSGGTLEWDAFSPAGTAVRVFARVSADRMRMGEWTELRTGEGNLDGLLAVASTFLQYRIDLSTSDWSVTPKVDGLRLSCDGSPAGRR